MNIWEWISLFTYTFAKLIPKKKNRWIFGAWFGNAVSDNSKAFYEYICKNYPEIECIWVTNKLDDKTIAECKKVKRNSLKSLIYIMTAEVAIMNQGYGDFNALNMLGGVYKVQLWHGIAWKKIVRDALDKPVGMVEKLNRRIFEYVNHYNLYITSSEIAGEVTKTAFGTYDDKILYVGQPRNEKLFDVQYCQMARNELKEKLGLDDQKVIVYMPTFRDNTEYVFSFCDEKVKRDFAKYAERLGVVLIEKSHYKSQQRNGANEQVSSEYVYNLPTADSQWLLAAADMLITDYSSCFFDYLVRNKPIIHYIYDFDYYKNQDRGLYYDVDDVVAGEYIYDYKNLFCAIERNICDESLKEATRLAMKDKFMKYETINNSELIYKRIKEDL